MHTACKNCETHVAATNQMRQALDKAQASELQTTTQLAKLRNELLVDISAATDTQWQRSINRKLRDLGFCLVTIPWCQSTRDVLSGIHIRHGMSERSAESTEWLTHAVIYCGNEIVHDPHPDNSGIMGWSWASVLAPLWSRP